MICVKCTTVLCKKIYSLKDSHETQISHVPEAAVPATAYCASTYLDNIYSVNISSNQLQQATPEPVLTDILQSGFSMQVCQSLIDPFPVQEIKRAAQRKALS
jgi:hypothetical protein